MYKRRRLDNNIFCEKLNFGPVEVIETEDGKFKIRQAVSSQNAFVGITTTVKERGMVVNETKTHLLCVSDSLNFKTQAFIEDPNGNKIEFADFMKVLGFHLSDRTGISSHVKETVKKLRQSPLPFA